MPDELLAAYGGGRATPQRRLIAQAAAAMPGAFTIEDLAAAVRAADTATGVATVYRAVAAMLTSGWLERVGDRGGRAIFARCRGGAHHHHVVCDRCGRVEATECPVALTPESSKPGGFVITRHEITLYGLCPTCANTPAEDDA